jgi:ABC-type dipeptide/oligopeptide/nickel transport system permease subunit
LPDILPTLMVPATLPIAVTIIAEAALSFHGARATAALALLGQHAERGAAFPHPRTLEGDLAGTCNFSRGASRGDGLRDALDPRQR